MSGPVGVQAMGFGSGASLKAEGHAELGGPPGRVIGFTRCGGEEPGDATFAAQGSTAAITRL